MGALSPWHWAILILVLVLLFGSKRLPDAARSLGKSMRIFKSEVKELQADNQSDAPVTPAQPAQQVASERVDAPVSPPVQNPRPESDPFQQRRRRRPGERRADAQTLLPPGPPPTASPLPIPTGPCPWSTMSGNCAPGC